MHQKHWSGLAIPLAVGAGRIFALSVTAIVPLGVAAAVPARSTLSTAATAEVLWSLSADYWSHQVTAVDWALTLLGPTTPEVVDETSFPTSGF